MVLCEEVVIAVEVKDGVDVVAAADDMSEMLA